MEMVVPAVAVNSPKIKPTLGYTIGLDLFFINLLIKTF